MYAGMDNELQSQDINGNIDIAYYKAAALDVIDRTFKERGIDPQRVTTNDLQYALRQCYYALFEPETRPFGNDACNIPYTTKNMEALLRLYYDICEMYRALPSLYVFERFTGIREDTLFRYVTPSKSDIVKARKAAIQNKLYEAPVGVITLANNDADSGLMYNRQNIADRETVKKALNFSELVKIAQKTTTAEDVSRDEGSNDDGGTV